MLDALRSLRLELDSIVEGLHALAGILVTSAETRGRIEQFFLSWTNLRSRLSAAQAPAPVISRADSFFTELVRLSGHRSKKTDYIRTLLAIRKVLIGQLLPEIAKIDALPARPLLQVADSRMLPEISGITNELIPRALYGWIPEMRRFLNENNYDHNVFIMVAYRKRLAGLMRTIKDGLTKLQLNAIVARDHQLTDDLYNPIACLLCCRYGIAIFDRAEKRQTHNSNIVYEFAMMQTLKRPCVILKHESLPTMPSDFLQKLYEPYTDAAGALKRVKEWWKRLENIENREKKS